MVAIHCGPVVLYLWWQCWDLMTLWPCKRGIAASPYCCLALPWILEGSLLLLICDKWRHLVCSCSLIVLLFDKQRHLVCWLCLMQHDKDAEFQILLLNFKLVKLHAHWFINFLTLSTFTVDDQHLWNKWWQRHFYIVWSQSGKFENENDYI